MEHLLEVIVPHLLLDSLYRLYQLNSTVRRIISRRSYWWNLIVRDIKLFPRSIELLPMVELKKYYLRRMNYPIGSTLNSYNHSNKQTTIIEPDQIVTFVDRSTPCGGIASTDHNNIVYRSRFVNNKGTYRCPEPIKYIADNMVLTYSGRIYERLISSYRLFMGVGELAVDIVCYESFGTNNQYLLILMNSGRVAIFRRDHIRRKLNVESSWLAMALTQDGFVQVVDHYLLSVDGDCYDLPIGIDGPRPPVKLDGKVQLLLPIKPFSTDALREDVRLCHLPNMDEITIEGGTTIDPIYHRSNEKIDENGIGGYYKNGEYFYRIF